MLPDPLHPAIVHFPVVLAVLVPLVAGAGFFAVGTGRAPRLAWLGVIALQAALVGTAWIAIETGEREEDRVEAVVAERHIEQHEENAERFLALAALVLPLAAAGMLSGRLGSINRGLTVALSLAALAAAGATGHSGGELVYRHGAALAYTTPSTGDASTPHASGRTARAEAYRYDDDHDYNNRDYNHDDD